MRHFFAFFLCFAFTGCAAQKINEAREAFAAARSACVQQWPEVTRETAIPRSRCISNAESITILPASGGFADLVQQRIAFRNDLAVKVASGEVSPTDAALRFAQYNSALASAANVREEQTEAARAQRLQAASSMLAASAAVMEAGRPSYPPPPIYAPPVRTHCYNNGNFTNCTSQ